MLEADIVEETTTSIATSGAGAVTLTAVTNKPRFSTVFGTGAVNVRYVIHEASTGKYERGKGNVASNVLTRTRPEVTYDGSTWNDLNPSALTFSASPTSGNVLIRMSATAAGRGSSAPTRQNTIAGDTWRDYPIGGNIQWGTNGASMTLTAAQEYYAPYFLNADGVLGGIQFEVMTLIAASNIKMAIYGCGSDGLPGSKILDFVTTATATTGVKTDTASASWTPAGKRHLAPGWYYIGFLPSHAIAIRGNNSADGQNTPNPLGRKDGYGYGGTVNVAGVYATGLPATPSLGSATISSIGATPGVPWFGLKVDG
jgi:hypothetical protein